MGEDTMSLGTIFAKSLLGRWATKLISGKLGRKVDVSVGSLTINHNHGDKVRVTGTVTLEMTEGELEALIETLT